MDARSKSCAHQGLSKHPSYGVDDVSKKPGYCSQHAKPGMVGCHEGVLSPRLHQGTVNRCGRWLQLRPEYCTQHVRPGMASVVGKRWAHQGCTKVPSYGVNDGNRKAVYCSQHAKDGMVDVRSNRCAQQDCTKRPGNGMDAGSKKAEYCAQHAKPGVVM